MRLTKNFTLSEFITSKFYNPQVQARVLQSFESNRGYLRTVSYSTKKRTKV